MKLRREATTVIVDPRVPDSDTKLYEQAREWGNRTFVFSFCLLVCLLFAWFVGVELGQHLWLAWGMFGFGVVGYAFIMWWGVYRPHTMKKRLVNAGHICELKAGKLLVFYQEQTTRIATNVAEHHQFRLQCTLYAAVYKMARCEQRMAAYDADLNISGYEETRAERLRTQKEAEEEIAKYDNTMLA